MDVIINYGAASPHPRAPLLKAGKPQQLSKGHRPDFSKSILIASTSEEQINSQEPFGEAFRTNGNEQKRMWRRR